MRTSLMRKENAYILSNELYYNSYIAEANVLYYLNKALHANDWFYAAVLPAHFFAEHPLGSVLGRAKYGDYLFVYQGTTVGGSYSLDTGGGGIFGISGH